jgi:hypothetical protein
MACSIPSHPNLHPRRSLPCCTLFLKRTKLQLSIVNLSPHQQSPESLVPWGSLLFRVVGWLSPWKVFQLARKIGRNVNGGRPRSGCMESSVGCSIGVSSLYVICVSDSTVALESLSASVANAGRVWCICRALCDYLHSRNLQDVPPPSRTICFGAGMAGQEMPIPDLPVFH